MDASSLGTDVSLAPVAQLGNFKSYPSTKPEEVVERIADAHIVITNKVRIFQPEMDAAPHLKLICVAATGTDNVDSLYAQSKGIGVKNVAGYSTDSVAQVTFAHLLHLITHLSYYNHYVYSGTYAQSPTATHLGPCFSSLNGKKLGIIGMGNIGQKVARIASAFGMEVGYYSTSGSHHCTDYPSLSLTALLETSDVVSIHAPLNERTRNLITIEQLRMMKPSALILNMGRGGIIHEPDLVQALNERLIAGAGVDVFSREPISPGHPFYGIVDQRCLLLTPHIAWTSIEARTLLVQKIAENIKAF
ncbi:MAG: D-2-hydroxyacid dehydrogenase [Bacteroidales bacterium]|nr:D-2-hydroxyacid dehydrogenase [Bacteroidales bacterium]